MFEYRLLTEAYRLKTIDREYEMHWQAWLSWNVQATKKKGKGRTSVFRTFKQFFNYEKMVNDRSDKEDSKNRDIINAMKKQKERRERDGKL